MGIYLTVNRYGEEVWRSEDQVMVRLKEVTQKDLDDVDARLNKAIERLSETAMEVKAERDKYAAVLTRIRRELKGAQSDRRVAKQPQSLTYNTIIEMIDEVLG